MDRCKNNIKNRLQTIQNRCARTILGSKPGSSAPPLLRELGWISLEDKRKVHKCVMMHKLINGNGPQKLLDRLQNYKDNNISNTRQATSCKLATVSHNTDYITKSYFYDTMKFWNGLPLSLRQTVNSKTFKERLQNHLLNLHR